jgi:hypothetical protein
MRKGSSGRGAARRIGAAEGTERRAGEEIKQEEKDHGKRNRRKMGRRRRETGGRGAGSKAGSKNEEEKMDKERTSEKKDNRRIKGENEKRKQWRGRRLTLYCLITKISNLKASARLDHSERKPRQLSPSIGRDKTFFLE